jgi:ATP-dependent Clp protease ATP-binding subunit ClpB
METRLPSTRSDRAGKWLNSDTPPLTGVERGSSMGCLNRQLDPSQTGLAAEKLALDLRTRVVGQDEAIQQIVNTYQTFLAGMSRGSGPVGSFLFLGPTGSGKTRMVEAAAESLMGNTRAVVKIDCAEFQHSHEIAKLIGAPPGYLGHRETHPALSQEALNQYHTETLDLSLVLFDEIEKASDALWNLLLGILDKATLTLGDNRRVDFSRSIIFMTSNLGAAEMGSILRPNFGFSSSEVVSGDEGKGEQSLAGKLNRAGLQAVRRKFTPEFINRIDKTVVFHALGEPELRRILKIELNLLQVRILKSTTGNPFVFTASESANDYLLRAGTDSKYGARHLKRAIDQSLVHPLSNLVATGQVRGGDLIRIDHDRAGDRLTFFKEAESMPFTAMAKMVDSSLMSTGAPLQASAAAHPPRLVTARSSRR